MSKFSALKAVKAPATTKRGRGRAAGVSTGKSNDPDYTAALAYIRKNTHQAVKVALISAGQQQDFSELVEELLTKWLKSRK